MALKKKIIYTACLCILSSSLYAAKEARFQRTDQDHKYIPPANYTLQNWWNGHYATGQWGGTRKALADRGIVINGSLTFAFLGNVSGGTSRGVAQNSSLGLSTAIDFGKLFQTEALNNTDFFIDLVQRGGDNLSSQRINNRFTVSQSYGGQNLRVNEVYLKQSFLDQKAWIKFGRLDAGNDFLSNPLFCTFVNNAFCGNPVGVFFNVPYSAYPNAQWGALIGGKPTEDLVAKFGVYNTNLDVSQNKYHGMLLSFSGNQGVQLISSLSYLLNQAPEDTGYTGEYTFGMMYYTRKNQNPGMYAGGNSYTGPYNRRDVGYFINVEQMFYRNGPKSSTRWLKAFANLEIFNHWDTNYMPLFFNGGLIYQGLLPSRPVDQLALGISYGRFGANSISNAGATFGGETLLELTYKVQVNKWWFVQPDLQLIIHPYGGSAQLAGTAKPPSSAWVVGFETGLTF